MSTPPNSPADPAAELFRLAFDLSPAGMLVVDASGAIVLANREAQRLFGYSFEELVGQPVERLVPGRFQQGHPMLRRGYSEAPESRSMGAGRDLRGLRKDGTEVPVEIGLNPVKGPEGLVILASVVDISARRRAEEHLRQSQKLEAIGTLAGGIAHDFNNVLLGIVGHAELAQRAPAGDLQRRDDLEQVLKAADRGRQLVQRILTFSRQQEVARAVTRLDRPVREALELLRATLSASIQMRESVDPGTPAVLSDDTQIHQVLMNLCTNASHAMPAGGVLEVRLAPYDAGDTGAGKRAGLRPGRYARITVEDDGAGMTSEVLQRAFEPFFSTKPPGSGTGLGLSVIHGIVESHGGAIEIYSEPGRGTRVDVYLPAHDEPRAAKPEDAPGEDLESRHVLLVDDEETLLLMMARQLRAMGHRVTARPSAVEAWEEFQRDPAAFDLVISDNSMPRMTGLELASRVRAARPDLPVLLISGLSLTADPGVLGAHGVTKLLGKPHTSRELEQAVRELLRPR